MPHVRRVRDVLFWERTVERRHHPPEIRALEMSQGGLLAFTSWAEFVYRVSLPQPAISEQPAPTLILGP